ncbi:MAG: hypothetical protein ACRDK2_09290 [Solirubrobacteraceae bacterium]
MCRLHDSIDEGAKEAGRFWFIERRLKLIQGGKADGSTLFWGEEPDLAWLAAHPDIDPEYICRWCGSNIVFGPRSDYPHSMAVYCDCRNYKTIFT